MVKSCAYLMLAAALSLAASARAQVTMLTGATVIDGSGATAQPGLTLIIENGRIRDIGPR
jgi:hypothetical protein